MSPLLLTSAASGLTPFQLFQQICRFVSPNSPQCIGLFQQKQQQQLQQLRQPFSQSPFTQSQPNQQQLLPPIANAGQNQVVSPGSLVTLDGTGSIDPNGGGTLVAYQWTQTSGSPSLILTGPSTARPTFTAPTNATILGFSLTVQDSTGLISNPATVSIPVQ